MKHSAVIVQAPMLDVLDQGEVAIFTRVIYSLFVGIDEQHTARWRRWWWRAMRSGILKFYPINPFSGAFHRRHMAIEGRIFDNQDNFHSRKAFRDWLKTGAAFGHWHASGGQLVFVPSSLSIEECSDDEMREFHTDAIEFLHTPYALATLFPAMSEKHRHETLELLLQNPKEDDDKARRY